MTPDQLREWANFLVASVDADIPLPTMNPVQGITYADLLYAHAAALEEVERLKEDIERMRTAANEMTRGAVLRAEKAEAERDAAHAKGREAGMREAAGMVAPAYHICLGGSELATILQAEADAILSAIEGGK